MVASTLALVEATTVVGDGEVLEEVTLALVATTVVGDGEILEEVTQTALRSVWIPAPVAF